MRCVARNTTGAAWSPSFERPDAFWAVPEAERPHRTLAGKSDCRIRNAEDTERRFFLRVRCGPNTDVRGRPPHAIGASGSR